MYRLHWHILCCVCKIFDLGCHVNGCWLQSRKRPFKELVKDDVQASAHIGHTQRPSCWLSKSCSCILYALKSLAHGLWFIGTNKSWLFFYSTVRSFFSVTMCKAQAAPNDSRNCQLISKICAYIIIYPLEFQIAAMNTTAETIGKSALKWVYPC